MTDLIFDLVEAHIISSLCRHRHSSKSYNPSTAGPDSDRKELHCRRVSSDSESVRCHPNEVDIKQRDLCSNTLSFPLSLTPISSRRLWVNRGPGIMKIGDENLFEVGCSESL